MSLISDSRNFRYYFEGEEETAGVKLFLFLGYLKIFIIIYVLRWASGERYFIHKTSYNFICDVSTVASSSVKSSY